MRLRTCFAALGLLAVLGIAAHSQVAGATYIGSRMCQACHKARTPKIVEAYAKTAHAHAMAKADTGTILADFSRDAPFTKDKVAYILGSGRHEQAYVDADFKVLPGIWRTQEKQWVTCQAGDAATDCLGCHTTGYNAEAKSWKEIGVGCEMCHGPGSKHAPARTKDTIVNPATLDAQHQAMTCGQCHSKGHDKSGKFGFPIGFTPGMDLGELFVDAKPTTPGRNQQLSELMQSPKHWKAGVTCVKCHDPHGDTDQPFQLRMAINDTCLQCHKDTVKSLPEHVASKGKTATADTTCATCHMPQGRHLFDKTLAEAAK